MIIRIFIGAMVWILSTCVVAKLEHDASQYRHVDNYLKLFDTTTSPLIWPGYQPSKQTIFFSFSSGYVLARNFNPQSVQWRPLTRDAGAPYVSRHRLALQVSNDTTTVTVDGQTGFAYRLDQLPPDRNYHAFIHENFHYFQQQHFAHLSKRGRYLNADDVVNLSLIELENAIILDYLKTAEQHYLKDYLVVNHYRQAQLKPASRDYERRMQRLEGSATYVELLSRSYYEKGHAKLLPILLQQERSRSRQSVGYNSIVDQAVRWRHYFIGASLCYALEQLQVKHWQQRLQQHDTDPTQLLTQYFTVLDDSPKKLQAIQSRYRYRHIKRRISKEIASYQRGVVRWNQLFNSQPGMYVAINKPRHDLKFSSSSARSYYLADHAVLDVNATGDISDDCRAWRLRFSELPLLLSNDERWLFKIENATKLTIDGKAYRAGDLRQHQGIRFSRLRLDHDHVKLSLRHKGILIADGNGLTIRFDHERVTPTCASA